MKRAFTLVELLLVILVIGMLSILVISAICYDNSCKFNIGDEVTIRKTNLEGTVVDRHLKADDRVIYKVRVFSNAGYQVVEFNENELVLPSEVNEVGKVGNARKN